MTQGKKQQNFQIGQIVYVLSDKAEAIVPAIVVEELVHKKLDGNSVSWKVAVGPPAKKKIVASDDLSGEIYTSLDEIRRVMMRRLSEYVENLVGKAAKRTEVWYGKQIAAHTAPETSGGKIDPASLIDSIDGREGGAAFRQAPGQEIGAHAQANPNDAITIKAPINQGPLVPNGAAHPNDPKAALRQKLVEMASVSDEELAQEEATSDAEQFVMTDDGRRIPVKFNVQE